MRKFVFIIVLMLNFVSVSRHGDFCIQSALGQNMGNEQTYHCKDDETGLEFNQPWPCDNEIEICACQYVSPLGVACDYSGACYTIEGHMAICHSNDDNESNPDGGDSDSGNDNGDGTSGSGGGGGGSSGSSSESETSGRRRTVTQIKAAARKAVKSIPGNDAQCNNGVKAAFKELFKTLPNGMDCRANQMVDYWRNSSDWMRITMSQAHTLANQGYFVVAGWKNPKGHGHVVVIVPGATTKSGWGNVPKAMDTGSGKRYESQPLSKSFGYDKQAGVEFYCYK